MGGWAKGLQTFQVSLGLFWGWSGGGLDKTASQRELPGNVGSLPFRDVSCCSLESLVV